MRRYLVLFAAVMAVPCLLAAEDKPKATPLLVPTADVREVQDNVRLADLDTNMDGKVTLDEFSAYYRRTGFGPFQVGIGPNQGASERLTDNLFKHLDLNKDGKLSKDEIGQASESLRKLDVDEDE